MSNNLKHLLTKVKYCLYLESKLSAEERVAHQWQMLTTHGGLQYIVGKGGANTCFYTIGTQERQLCYPDELVKVLTRLASQKYACYAICDKSKNILRDGLQTLEQAKGIKPKRAGLYLVGIDARGKKHRLYYSSAGLVDNTWVKFS